MSHSEAVSPVSSCNHTPQDEPTFDVIGIGALNVDYIAGSTSIRRADPDFQAESGKRFDLNVENLATEEAVRATIARLGHHVVQPSLGGSAFMAIYTLAQMDLGLRLGYVGVTGREPDPRLSFIRTFDELDIDRAFVAADGSEETGLCVSFASEGERTLLTCPRANAAMGHYIEECGDELVRYLAQAKVLHVSSFLDEETPRQLGVLLSEVKRRRPDIIVTFDPGHLWASSLSSDVQQLLVLCDHLIVNYREFKALGGNVPGASDNEIAHRVFARCSETCVVIVVKKYDCLQIYRRRGENLECEDFRHRALESIEIEDATGAGDVFAAGHLASISSSKLHLELGALLGMRLARHKLRFVGSHGHEHFAELTGGFLRNLEEETAHWSLPNGVFISHGSSDQWLVLRDRLESWGIRVHCFESENRSGTAVIEALTEYLDICSFAICMLTAEDVTKEGEERARQNVIHEAGLFQGKFGFRRVALLVEENCGLLSNLNGLVHIEFAPGHVEHAMMAVHDVLVRERMLTTSAALVGSN